VKIFIEAIANIGNMFVLIFCAIVAKIEFVFVFPVKFERF
jgi:hypothetical protein